MTEHTDHTIMVDMLNIADGFNDVVTKENINLPPLTLGSLEYLKGILRNYILPGGSFHVWDTLCNAVNLYDELNSKLLRV